MMIEIESDPVMYLSATLHYMRSDWFFPVPTYHVLTDESLQFADKDQQESRAVVGTRETARCRCKSRLLLVQISPANTLYSIHV